MSTPDVYTGELNFSGDDPYKVFTWQAFVYRNNVLIAHYYTDVRIFALVWMRWRVSRDKVNQRKNVELKKKAQKNIQL